MALMEVGRFYRWSVETGKLQEAPRLRSSSDWLEYLDSERLVISGRGPGSNQILKGEERLAPLVQHAWPIQSMAVARGSNAVVTGSVKNSVLVWDAEDGGALARVHLHRGPVWSVAGHGKRADLRILSCGDDGAVIYPLDVVTAAERVAPRRMSDWDRTDLRTILGID